MHSVTCSRVKYKAQLSEHRLRINKSLSRIRHSFRLIPRAIEISRFQLPGIGRRGRQVLHMGLEDNEIVQEVEGARRCVHRRAVASARALEARHRRMGRQDQVLGLNTATRSQRCVHTRCIASERHEGTRIL